MARNQREGKKTARDKKTGAPKRTKKQRESGKVGKGSAKQTAKFHASGGLDRELKARKAHAELKKKIDHREHQKKQRTGGAPNQAWKAADAEAVEMGRSAEQRSKAKGKGKAREEEEDLEMDDEELSEDEADSLADIDDEIDASKHKLDLEALKSKDPEFYKYLAENDADLLAFDEDDELSVGSDLEITGETAGEPSVTEVTMVLLRRWQTDMIRKRSLKALRTLLLALRSIAYADEELKEGQDALPFIVRDPAVYSKLIVTSLKYMPSLLQHYVPAKELPNGRYRVSTQAKQYSTAQRMIRSFFASLIRLLDQATDAETIHAAVSETTRLVPYLVDDAKTSRQYLRTLLSLWSTSQADNVRLASFLVIRRIANAGGPALLNAILKGVYMAILQAARDTNVHTLPSINLMKNSASELYLLNTDASYQLAFNYIRQLAIHLRNSMKSHTKDGFKQVYNWQYVHSIDFWSLVLSSACDTSRDDDKTRGSLQPLIYPLVQVTLGAAKLVPTSRYYPLRFHLIRALLRITQRTGTFIPIAPLLLDMLDCAELKRKGKPSSQLKSLDFTYYVRAPPSYLRTRTYADGLVDELTFHLLEVFATISLNIAFPEIVIPSLVLLKRHAKKKSSGNPRMGGLLKTLCERMEANRDWILAKRAKIEFAPGNHDQVDAFLRGEELSKTPLGGHLRREKKMRDQRQEMLERAARDEGDDDDDVRGRKKGKKINGAALEDDEDDDDQGSLDLSDEE